MEYREFSAKTVDDAITEACQSLSVTSDRLEYEVVEEGEQKTEQASDSFEAIDEDVPF